MRAPGRCVQTTLDSATHLTDGHCLLALGPNGSGTEPLATPFRQLHQWPRMLKFHRLKIHTAQTLYITDIPCSHILCLSCKMEGRNSEIGAPSQCFAGGQASRWTCIPKNLLQGLIYNQSDRKNTTKWFLVFSVWYFSCILILGSSVAFGWASAATS